MYSSREFLFTLTALNVHRSVLLVADGNVFIDVQCQSSCVIVGLVDSGQLPGHRKHFFPKRYDYKLCVLSTLLQGNRRVSAFLCFRIPGEQTSASRCRFIIVERKYQTQRRKCFLSSRQIRDVLPRFTRRSHATLMRSGRKLAGALTARIHGSFGRLPDTRFGGKLPWGKSLPVCDSFGERVQRIH